MLSIIPVQLVFSKRDRPLVSLRLVISFTFNQAQVHEMMQPKKTNTAKRSCQNGSDIQVRKFYVQQRSAHVLNDFWAHIYWENMITKTLL